MCDGQKSISCFLRLGSDDFALRRTGCSDTWSRMGYFLIAMLVVSSYVDSSADNIDPYKKVPLSGDIDPIRYDLRITPTFDVSEPYYNGHAVIHMKVLKQSNFIVVHSKQLKITAWRVLDRRYRVIRGAKHFEHVENDYLVFQTKLPLPGKVKLELSFLGKVTTIGLNDHHPANVSGLYKIAYVDKMTGKESWLAATELHPGSARLVFPCFDEPRFKPRFNITVLHPKNFSALSNMPLMSRHKFGGAWDESDFKLSPRMNSHLVAFAVSEFGFKNTTINETEYRLWARRDRLNELDYALNVTTTIQQFLFQELGQPSLDLPEKLDQFAVPGDVVHDNSEHWGLATYKESRLLINTTQENDDTKENAVKLIARTLTHHYFEEDFSVLGSKTHVWLKEGLTTLYSARAVREVDPKLYLKQLYDGKEKALKADGTHESQTLVHLSNPPDDEKPDPFIRGEKGAAVLCMIESFVGEDIFRRAIKTILTEYSNRTKVTRHLFSALQKEYGPGLDIATVMSSWVFEKGIPVVQVELLPTNEINATQKQFLAHPDIARSRTDKWYVPLNYRTRAGNHGLVWLNKTSAKFGVPLQSSQDWILFNGNRSGYYRVNYDTILWSRITDQLNANHTVFPELTRSTLLNDAFNLAEAEQLGYDTLLNLTKHVSKETDLTPWQHIIDGFHRITLELRYTTAASRFKSYVLNLTSKMVDEFLVTDGVTYPDKELREKITVLSCNAGHRGCVDIRTRAFKVWIQNRTHVVPEHSRRDFYCTAMAHSVDASDWTTTFERYMMNSTSEDEKKYLLYSLCCSRNFTAIEWLLDFSLSKADPDADFTIDIMKYVSENPSAEGFLWNWYKRNYAEIDAVYYDGLAGFCLLSAAFSLNTEAQYQELQNFYTVYSEVEDWTKSHLTFFIGRRLRWMNKNFDTTVSWLENYGTK